MIKFFVMDVDGTLTDGKIYIGNKGEVFKAFNVKDGQGILNLIKNNIIPVVITARTSEIVLKRCEELGVMEVHQGVKDKLSCLKEIVRKYSEIDGTDYSLKNVAYIGDDVLDLQCMLPIREAGGICGCPNDAVQAVKVKANYVCQEKAGSGAVREFVDATFRIKSEAFEYSIKKKVHDAIEHISTLDLESFSPGKYFLNNDCFFMIQEYFANDETNTSFESHRNHVDIQWIIKGNEKFLICDTIRLLPRKEYNYVDDVMFYYDCDGATEVLVSAGNYIVLYPEHGHKVGKAIDCKIKKAVVKVRIK